MANPYAEVVAAGAAHLDQQYPGWWRKIALDLLEMDWCSSCILGQLYGEAHAVRTTACGDVEAAIWLGFTVEDRLRGDDAAWARLKSEWVSAIVERRHLERMEVELG